VTPGAPGMTPGQSDLYRGLDQLGGAGASNGGTGSGVLPPGDSAAAIGNPKAAATTPPLPFRTAAQIGRETAADVQWAVRPWLAFGAATELDGKIKVAGKTTFVSYMVRALLDGEPFLGEPTTRSRVILLTEQSPVSFRETLRRAGLLTREDLFILYCHDAFGRTWSDVAGQAIAEARRRQAKVIVVDTFGRFAGLRGDSENSAGEAEAAVQAITLPAAAHDIAVMFLRHERKAGGEVGEAARGSSAFGGAVDIIMSLRRLDNAARPTMREIRSLSRFDETPDQLIIDLTENGYVALEATEIDPAKGFEDHILAVLPTDEAHALTEHEVIQRVPAKRTKVQNVLKDFLDDPSKGVIRIGSGKRGSAFRFYRKSPNPGEELSSVKPAASEVPLLPPPPKGGAEAAITERQVMDTPKAGETSQPQAVQPAPILPTPQTTKAFKGPVHFPKGLLDVVHEAHQAGAPVTLAEAIELVSNSSCTPSHAEYLIRLFDKTSGWRIISQRSPGGILEDVLLPVEGN
jgi:hypothetical protein